MLIEILIKFFLRFYVLKFIVLKNGMY